MDSTIQEAINQAWQNLQTNQIFTGGAVLMAAGFIVHQCRAVPARIFRWIKERFVIEITVRNTDEAFAWIEQWLANHRYSQHRARSLMATSKRPDDDDDVPSSLFDPQSLNDNRPQIIFSPDQGTHFLLYKRRLMVLTRGDKRDPDGAAQKARDDMGKFGTIEQFNIRLFTRNRQLAKGIFEEARELVHPSGEHCVRILSCGGGYHGCWCVRSKRLPRPLESVILADGVVEELIVAIEKFRQAEAWYRERGIPWRMGVLLSGTPGSGKSSLVHALASHFGMDVGLLATTSSTLDDDGLANAFAQVPNSMLVLIEDIDCVFHAREGTRDKDNKLTFSGLLNAIDGAAASEGRILFMTTNHPELLDPALIRPGRVDLRLEIGTPTAGQVARIYKRFFPQATESQVRRFCANIEPSETSMAALQDLLIKYSSDPELPIAGALELILDKKAQEQEQT